MSDHPRIETRRKRLKEYLRHNGGRILVDSAILATWIIVAVTIFEWIDYHRWLLYFMVFLGVLIYSRVTPTWERPYTSPDEPQAE